MSTIVKDIRDALESEIAGLLPDHAIADNVFDVERNPYTTKTKLFGVRPLGKLRNFESPTKYVVVDHDFEVLFIDNYTNITHKDDPQQTIVLNQFEYETTITSAIECNKLGLGGQVMTAQLSSVDEPEFFEESNLSVLRVTYTIKYRSPL